MSTKHLSLKPHGIRGHVDAWWYENSHGIDVIVEPQKRTTTERRSSTGLAVARVC